MLLKEKKRFDYYAFGSPMPGRQFNSSGYRYGFNGKENDNEVKGTGNQQDYGMRIYDPRLGRFLSVDPIAREYPFLTPYQFANNNPIWAIDLDGLEPSEPKTEDGYNLKIKTLDLEVISRKLENINTVFKKVNLSPEDKKNAEYTIKKMIGEKIEWDDNGNPIVPVMKLDNKLAKLGKAKDMAIDEAKSKVIDKVKDKVVKKAEQKIAKKYGLKVASFFVKSIAVAQKVFEPTEMKDQMTQAQLSIQMQKVKLENAVNTAVTEFLLPKENKKDALLLEANIARPDATSVEVKIK